MGIFKALGKLGSATVQTAILPLDAAWDVVRIPAIAEGSKSSLARRAKKIGKDLGDAHDESFED